MKFTKIFIASCLPALLATACGGGQTELPPADTGFNWQTSQVGDGLPSLELNSYIGPPTWSEDGLSQTGAEQYFQRTNTCNGFPVCVGYDTKDYRFRVYTQSTGQSDKAFLHPLTPGILAQVYHLSSQPYWLVAHQTESQQSQIVFSRLSGGQLRELGRESLDNVDLYGSWWIPAPDGSRLGRAACFRFPRFDGNNPSNDPIVDSFSGLTLRYGECAISFIDASTGQRQGNAVKVSFPWVGSTWSPNSEPYDSLQVPRTGFGYWRGDGSFAVTDYQNAAYAVFPGDTQGSPVNLRPCRGPLTASAAINAAGEVLGVEGDRLQVVAQRPNNTFSACH